MLSNKIIDEEEADIVKKIFNILFYEKIILQNIKNRISEAVKAEAFLKMGMN